MIANNALLTAINKLDKEIVDPNQGLPEEIFWFASRITPMVNVDLLIRDETNQILLTWRGDEYYSPGWHVPGGIVRYKESMFERLEKVAWLELGARVSYNQVPVAVNEVIRMPERKTRGHFISFLYECKLETNPCEDLKYVSGEPVSGAWKWHVKSTDKLIPVHQMYKSIIDGNKPTSFHKSDLGIARLIA